MGKKLNIFFVSVLVLVAALVANVYFSLRPDQAWAVSYDHSADIGNLTYHSRYRGAEWTNRNEFFVQWWNYIVVDSETQDHFNFAYQISRNADNSKLKPVATVGAAFSEGKNGVGVEGNTEEFPIDSLRVLNHADLEYLNEAGEITYFHRFLDDDTVHITGAMPGVKTLRGEPINWDLKFFRIHGVFLNEDVAKADTSNSTQCQSGSSSLYGCNSEVEGYIKVGKKLYTFNRTSRFRAYGGGSWGCALPGGKPAIEHPWSWTWIVVPGENGPQDDFSLTFGDGRFAVDQVISPIYGSYAIVGIPGKGKDVFTTRDIAFRHKQFMQIPIIKSSSHGYFTRNNVDKFDWFNYTDEFGTALIPARQVFTVESQLYKLIADVRAEPKRFFRLPIALERELKPRVYSDFRALGAEARLQLWSKNNETREQTLIFDKTAREITSVEYAYEAPLNVDMEYVHAHGTSGLAKAHELWLKKQNVVSKHDITTGVSNNSDVLEDLVKKAAEEVIAKQRAEAAAKKKQIYQQLKSEVEARAEEIKKKVEEEARKIAAKKAEEMKEKQQAAWVNEEALRKLREFEEERNKKAPSTENKAEASASGGNKKEDSAAPSSTASIEKKIDDQLEQIKKKQKEEFEIEQQKKNQEAQELAAKLAKEQFLAMQAKQARRIEEEKSKMTKFEAEYEQKKVELQKELERREKEIEVSFAKAKEMRERKDEDEAAKVDDSIPPIPRPPNWREEWEESRKKLEEEDRIRFEAQLKVLHEEFEKVLEQEKKELERKKKSSEKS